MKDQNVTFFQEPVTAASLLQSAREIGPALTKYVEQEERERRISSATLSALRKVGFLRLSMPDTLEGLEIDPLTTAKLVEEIARHNAGAAWSMMVANTATWWCSMLSDDGIDEIYKDGPDTFIAGAFHPPMQATEVTGGYRITGRSPLASNVHEAQWIFVSAIVMEEGQPKMTDGRPDVRGVFMNANDCTIPDTWHTIGMHATDSNDVEANQVFVPAHLSIPLAPGLPRNQHYKGALYQFPAIGANIVSLIAPVSLALASSAIDEIKKLAEKKTPFGSAVTIRDRGSVQRKIGMAEALVQSSRAYLHQTLTDTWNKTVAGQKLTMEERAGLLLAATHTNQSCFQAADMMYSVAGTTGVYTKSRLSHIFTDMQVVRQHGFANESRYETVAQVYMGLPGDLPVLGM